MILCDAGPLVAIIDEDDPFHEQCTLVLDGIASETLVTTWPCLTEAMHLLYRADGHRAQELLWTMIDRTALALHTTNSSESQRMRQLMKRYADAPMDLADASLVAAAERLMIRRVFTLDRHFRAYLIHDKESFDIVPAGLAP